MLPTYRLLIPPIQFSFIASALCKMFIMIMVMVMVGPNSNMEKLVRICISVLTTYSQKCHVQFHVHECCSFDVHCGAKMYPFIFAIIVKPHCILIILGTQILKYICNRNAI